MIEILGLQFEPLDLIALSWFCVSWSVYSVYADHKEESNLVKTMHKYRIRWMKHMIRRTDRLIDVRIIGGLLDSTVFLASTSIFIIGGLAALLGYGPKAAAILENMPFAVHISSQMWILKTMLLLAIFTYSFFKFTWVIRQFNYASVLIVAAPVCTEDGEDLDDLKLGTKYVLKIASMISNAGRHFNMGVRSYYFGLVALTWYISPVLFIACSVLVLMVLYRREFMSKTLTLLE